MADNISALNGLYMNPYTSYMNPYASYMNQAALGGLYDTDSYFTNPMCGSVWNMMPFTPSFGGGYQSYYNNMTDYLNFTSDYNLQLVQNQRRNDLRINGADEAISNAASVLNEKIVSGEQDQIQGAYAEFVKAVAAKYPGESEEDIIARAKNNYNAIYNSSLTDDLRKYGHDSFTHGLYKALSFGTYYSSTAEDNISAITGQPVAKWDKVKEKAGLAAGGAAITGTGLFAAKHLGWLSKIPKGGWLCAGILAAGAAVAAIFGSK